jgi:hypothetical protein
LAVATTTTPVTSGCRTAIGRRARSRPVSRVTAHRVRPAQVAHARCREGSAAYWSGAGRATGLVPSATATLSTKPTGSSSRGGATGHRTNVPRPTALVATRELRATRYTCGAASQQNASTAMVTVRCAAWYHHTLSSRSVP